MIAAAMEITATPPTMPPAIAPAFELLPPCDGWGKEVDKEVAEMSENWVGAGDEAATVAPPIPVVTEELG